MGNWHTWVEISKSAIEHNLAQYQNIIGNNNVLAPVVKSNAYGHGIAEISYICKQSKNKMWFCVTNLGEAITLREGNVTNPILVLSYIEKDPELAALLNISVVAYDADTIKKLNTIGKKINKIFNIHIKVDTGLSRLGVDAHNAIELIKEAKNLENINIEGIWTHFAEAQAEDRTFTNKQNNIFYNLIKNIKKIGIKIPFIHSCNSSAIATVNLDHTNFFRIGIGLYGYWPSDYIKKISQKKYPDFNLKPSLTWKSKIFHIKHIPAGRFVGYNRTYQTKKDTTIAIIPVGYFDGYDRRLSNKGNVIINDQIAPILGIVCMNVLTVDVTNIKNTNIGDEVILVGNRPGIKVNEIAKLIHVNPREITTNINPEIPRIIVD
ncbi:alanine racemase [Candidatus Dependentiae bacterium]